MHSRRAACAQSGAFAYDEYATTTAHQEQFGYMEDHSSPPELQADRRDSASRSLADQRGRAEAFLAEYHSRLERDEHQLIEQLQTLVEELTGRESSIESQHAAYQSQTAQLASQQANINAEREEVNAQRKELDACRDSIDADRTAVDAQQETLDSRDKALAEKESIVAAAEEHIASEQTELASREAIADQHADELLAIRQQLESDRAAIEEQRTLLVEQEALVAADLDAIARSDEHFAADLAKAHEQNASLTEQLEDSHRKHDELAAQRGDWLKVQEALGTDLSARDNRIESLEAELTDVGTQFDALNSDNVSLTERVEELTTQLATASNDQQAIQSELDNALDRASLTQQELDIHKQRSDELEAHVESLQADHAQATQQANEQLEEHAASLDQLRTQLAHRQQECDQLIAERDTLESDSERLQEAVKQATAHIEQLRLDLEAKNAEQTVDPAEAAEWGAERETLIDKLAGAEMQVAELAQLKAEFEKQEGLERRFEMAVEDARKLKTRVAELEEQIAQGGGTPSTSTPPASTGNLNWEAMKRQMMDALDEDLDEADATEQQEKITIEGTIRITDDVIAERDREIDELRERLSKHAGAAADSDAAAVAELIDSDEAIQQERAELAELKGEWKEKLRQAEIEISVERAKMARQKAAIEDQQQTLDASDIRHESNGDNVVTDGKPQRGRWLSRLGLKDLDE